MERKKKRQKINDDNCLNNSDHEFIVQFHTAMEIAYQHRLQDEFRNDAVSLQCMRESCRTFRGIATKIASSRIKHLGGIMQVSPLTNGMIQFDSNFKDRCDLSRCHLLEGHEYESYPERLEGRFIEFERNENIILNSSDFNTFIPRDENASFQWYRPGLEPGSTYYEKNKNFSNGVEDYFGQIIKVSHVQQDTETYPRIRSVTRELEKFHLKDVVGIHKEEKKGVTIEYEILHCDNREEYREEFRIVENDNDLISEDFVQENTNQVSSLVKYRFRGRARLIRVIIDFKAFVIRDAVDLMRQDIAGTYREKVKKLADMN